MLYTSKIELSKSAYETNLLFIRDLLGSKTQLSSVVKGNAYGHGIRPFSNMAHSLGVNHFCVFSADEAYDVQQSTSSKVTIIVMGMLDDFQLEWAIMNGIEFFVFDLDRLTKAITIAKQVKKKAKIHIELETGMNRTGFQEQDFNELIAYLPNEHIQIKALCTHYAGAESVANYYRIQDQIKRFKRYRSYLNLKGIKAPKKHTACSAASMRFPETRMDLARIGILQYGFFPSKETLVDYQLTNQVIDNPLRRLITWKTQLMDARTVKKGSFIGYGTSYLANTDMTIGLIPVGYSHGFSRSLSNQGRVLIHGKRVPVIGMVNMNMTAIDISGIENPQKGDEIILIGNQGDQEISVASFSESSNQVNYEMLTRLPHSIPRIIVE